MKLQNSFQLLDLSCSIFSRVEETRKSDDDHFNEFVPLLRTGKGEDVSIPELKTAVATAIEVLLGKLNSKEVWLVRLLSGARIALTDNQENNNVTLSLDKKD
jgi:hypothetical protein